MMSTITNGYLVLAELLDCKLAHVFLIVYADTCGCIVSAYTHVYISCSAFRACIAVLHVHLYKPLSGIRAKDLRTTDGGGDHDFK